MKYTIIAPVGDNSEALFTSIKEFSIERIILVSPKKYMNEAKKTIKELKRFKIPIKIIQIDDSWESLFKAISDIKSTSENILINAATADRDGQCAATCAAFVNGLKAFSVNNGKIMMLPVLKFSYYKMIPEKKLEILKVLRDDKTCCASFDELSKKMKMSLPLVSYHVNGNIKSDGLVQMGLVEAVEKRGRLSLSLTMLGKLLIDGYVDGNV